MVSEKGVEPELEKGIVAIDPRLPRRGGIDMVFKCSAHLVLILAGWALVAGPVPAAVPLAPGIYAAEDLTAPPEPVTLASVGTDPYDAATFQQSTPETFNLEVYELSPGVYNFVTNPAGKTDTAARHSDIGGINISSLVADSGADGVLFRGTGRYPGETAIRFGLISEYPPVPTTADGSLDVERAAGEIGYQFYTGRRYFNVDGVVAAFENLSIGDHANNNTGVVHTFGGGVTFMRDVWIFNVYDGVFFDDAGEGYFVNCIFHQTYQPWNLIDDALADLYFTDEWNTLVTPEGLSGTLYADGTGISEEAYPQVQGVILGNQTASGYNINLFETEGANPQKVYLKNCTLVKHQIRDSNRLWRHNTDVGEGAYVLIEDSMILCVDLSPNAQIRIDTDDPDFYGSIYHTKFWNYASGNAQVTGITAMNWNIDPADAGLLQDAQVDIATPGGLDIPDVHLLFRLDGRNLTTFMPGAVELTLASDGGPVGYRLPATAPAGPLPVTTGGTPVEEWAIY
ncbi:MAG TPA: hypothetical protein PK878_16190 [bacterium]|nr:hypothetical protein [Candidatus Omnitrophota bacterium]HOJ61825.1 hypothetical protein [bacterium]